MTLRAAHSPGQAWRGDERTPGRLPKPARRRRPRHLVLGRFDQIVCGRMANRNLSISYPILTQIRVIAYLLALFCDYAAFATKNGQVSRMDRSRVATNQRCSNHRRRCWQTIMSHGVREGSFKRASLCAVRRRFYIQLKSISSGVFIFGGVGFEAGRPVRLLPRNRAIQHPPKSADEVIGAWSSTKGVPI